MRVVLISTDAKVFEKGSAVWQRMIWYGELFDELHIVLLNTGKQSEGKLSERVFIHPTNSKSKVSAVFDSYKIARRVVKDYGEVVVSAQDPFETGIVGLFLKLFYGLPLQIQLHTDFNNKYFLRSSPLNFIRFFLAHITLPFADSVRVVSRRAGEGIKELVKDFTVLPIMTKEAVNEGAESAHTPYEPIRGRILTAARLEREKDIETAIRAFSLIAEKYTGAELHIAGEGSEKDNLAAIAKELGILPRVKFLGWQNDLTPIYKSADIYISTSLFEGYGMSIVDAASFGLPLVLSDAGVAREIFENDQSAFISKPGDAVSFSVSLHKLLASSDLRQKMGKHAREAALSSQISHGDYLGKFKKSMEDALLGYRSRNFLGRLSAFVGSLFTANKILRFIAAGGTAASSQIITLYIFTDIFDLWYLYSSIIAFVVGITVSFVLQKLWAFRDLKMEGAHRQFAKYVIVGLVGVLINTILMYFFVDFLHLWYILAQIITGVFIAIFNYFSYRRFIFTT